MFSMARYVTPKEASKYFGVCLHTLRRWEKQGWISAVRTGRARRYDLDSYIKLPTKPKHIVLYARVSSRSAGGASHGQKPDLERQIARLVNLYPGAEVVGEVGGGLNFKRPQFLALLERVRAGAGGSLQCSSPDHLFAALLLFAPRLARPTRTALPHLRPGVQAQLGPGGTAPLHGGPC